MYIYPAIDLYGGKAVRLLKGEYDKMTVYNDNPLSVALDFQACGAKFLHLVDLEGAQNGGTPNLSCIQNIVAKTDLFTEVGGGIRSMEVVESYCKAGVDRVILGTAAVTDPAFLESAISVYGDKIAVGADVKDGFVAIKGWTEKSAFTCMEFCDKMQKMGVKTIICTDVSKDGAMQGTNHALYEALNRAFDMQIIASGGVSSMDDVRKLAATQMYGAIIGKAYYTGAIDLKTAIEVAAK